ncbi:MAG: 1,4-alpha-glucan branching enzyme GlgB, partial [Chlamydiae bacterium]|nr:1,4-alpha-glucan branching enzyme GlgB [Chlamydiota bacterium]
MQEKIHELIIKGEFSDPHKILGLQAIDEKRQVIRLWRPDSTNCALEVRGKEVEAKQIHDAGIYEYEVSTEIKPTDYRIFHHNGKLAHDPYAFAKIFGDLDEHLVSQGLHYELYDLLGATPKVHQGVAGVNFAVWAPNAISLSLLAEFNDWNGRMNPMRQIGNTGVWELFIPNLSEGEKYKFEVVTKEREHFIKTDPVAHFAEVRPKNSSIVFDVSRFHWSDAHWIKERKKFRFGNVPISIYEVHLGSWRRKHDGNGSWLNYRDLADQLVVLEIVES